MFGPKELIVVLVVLVIVLVVFGPKRIKSLGSELGNAIKGFRNAVREKDADQETPTGEALARDSATDPNAAEAQAETKASKNASKNASK